MDRKTKDRKKWEDEMYQAHRAARLESLITAAVIVMAAIALGVSLYGLIGYLVLPMIEALGGAR